MRDSSYEYRTGLFWQSFKIATTITKERAFLQRITRHPVQFCNTSHVGTIGCFRNTAASIYCPVFVF
jgi:hypothetical protein